MLKFEVKQRMFALGSKFDIINSNDEIEYYVEADFFDVGKNISVFNKNGIKVLYMKQIIKLGAHKYKIYDGNNIEIGEVNKELLIPNYKIEGNFGTIKMSANDMLARHYTISKDGNEIGRLGKKVTLLRDEYYLETYNTMYIDLLVGLLIMIDMIKFNNKNN